MSEDATEQRDKLLERKVVGDGEDDEVDEDENSVEQLLKDLETEPDISDIDDDDESVEDLLKALVEDEEAKLKSVFSKRRKNSGSNSARRSKSEEVIELDGIGDGGQLLLDKSSLQLQLEIPPAFESTYKPMSPTILQKNKRARKLLKKHASQSGKIACGVFCILFIFSIGLGVSFLAYWLNMKDLFIIGGIFTFGGVVFLLGFIIVRCTISNDPEVYLTLYKSSPSDSV